MKSLFNRILPTEFYQIGDRIINWVRKKKELEAGIVDIAIENLGGHLYRVICNITYNEGGQLKRSTSFLTTTVVDENIPTHISHSIEDNSLDILKLNEEDLEILNNEIVYNLKFKLKWNDLIAKWNRDNISFVNLTDRVFYTLVECYNANERLINCQRIGIIDELPSEISTKLYPFNSYRFEL